MITAENFARLTDERKSILRDLVANVAKVAK